MTRALPPLSAEPLVSVVVPCYNMAEHTHETITSLLNQTYPRLEIVAVDDGSTDRTPQVLASFAGRVTALRQENAGACRARNLGFSRTRGELVAFLDCDDLWEPGKAEKAVAAFRARPEAGLVYHHALWIDERGRIVGPRSFPALPSGRIFESLAVEDFIRNSTPVLRRAALEAVGLWDEAIFTTADWELWLRLAKDYPAAFIPEPLSRTRVSSYYNARNIEQTRRETLYLFEKHGGGLPEDSRRKALARMHFYLSRLFAANRDYAAARREALEAARLEPVFKHRLGAWLYGLGEPVNDACGRVLQAVSEWRARG